MWKKTTETVCLEIRKYHTDDLIVFASYTDIDGYSYEWSDGHPEILTEWGFKNTSNPIYKVLLTKQSVHDIKWKYEYFLYCN